MSLTDEGRVFHDRGLQILADVDDAEASVATTGRAGTPRHVPRLTVPDEFGQLVVLPLLHKYLAAWPEVQAEVSFSDRPANIVEEGFNLALRIGEPPPDTRLVAQFKALLCASPAYMAAHGEPRTIEDLAQHEGLVFTSRNQRQSWRLRESPAAGDWTKAPIKSRLRLESGEAIRHAALAGQGIAFLPDFLVADNLAVGRLRQVLPGVDAGFAKIVAIYPTRRLLEPRVRRFIDLMVEELGG